MPDSPTLLTSVLALGLLGCATGDQPTVPDPSPTADTGALPPVDADGDGVPADEDCDDADPEVGAGMPTYADVDRDGYGDPATERSECTLTEGRVTNADDCDDAHAEASPDGVEICDGLDNDCDPTTSEEGRVERTDPDGVRTDDAAAWTAGTKGAPTPLTLDAPATFDVCGVHAYVTLDIQTDVAIRGHGAAILDGGGTARVLRSVGASGGPEAPAHTLTLSGLTVQGGAQERFGTGAFVSRSALVLEDVTFTDNVTNAGGTGGALFVSDGTVTANGGTFVGNAARTAAAVGGTGSIGRFTDTTFTDNGGQYLDEPITTVEAGAIRWAGSLLTLDGVALSDHTASGGGAVLATSVDLTLRDVVWERNVSDGLAGALWLSDSVVTMEGGRFEDNHAGTVGGAVYVEVSTLVGSGGTEFRGNTAGTDGAAAYLTRASTVDLDQARFVDNAASRHGGALYVDEDVIAAVSGSTLQANRALFGGGAYYAGGQLTLSDNDWTDNVATTAGGALYTLATGPLEFVDADNEDFSGNTPQDHQHAPSQTDYTWGLGASFECTEALAGCG
ncbi:MAG: putative metal-binding motif-containing protein [Myxococcota bacterium]